MQFGMILDPKAGVCNNNFVTIFDYKRENLMPTRTMAKKPTARITKEFRKRVSETKAYILESLAALGGEQSVLKIEKKSVSGRKNKNDIKPSVRINEADTSVKSKDAELSIKMSQESLKMLKACAKKRKITIGQLIVKALVIVNPEEFSGQIIVAEKHG